jgi:hypothetical protein
VALAALTLLSACGKKTFQKLDYSTTAVAGQYVYIKPKLDLVIFQDDSDSMYNAMGQLKPQLQSFLSSLDTNWEYRVVVLPLLWQQSVSSKYVIATDCSSVTGVGQCLSPSQVGFFNGVSGDSAWITNDNQQTGNTDLGFQNMKYNTGNLMASGFLRSDSVKAFMVVSNGEDVSGVNLGNSANYAYRGDGAQTGYNYGSAEFVSSFNNYFSYFNGLKTSSSLQKFYSVVAAANYSGCWNGGRTWQGKRYMDMASALGGASFDLCNGGLTSVLSDIHNSLQTVVQTVEFNYVVISTSDEPDPSTIVLKKNGVTVPQSGSDGWTYVGMRTGATSDYPTVGNVRTGYMVRLEGSAKFKGSDSISIDFQKK